MENQKITSEEWEKEFDKKIVKLKGGILMPSKTQFILDNFFMEGIKNFISALILQKQKEAIEPYKDALIWCSGSEDFQLEGKARKGWEKICLPLLSETTDLINVQIHKTEILQKRNLE
jgi:hypothetical protein